MTGVSSTEPASSAGGGLAGTGAGHSLLELSNEEVLNRNGLSDKRAEVP